MMSQNNNNKKNIMRKNTTIFLFALLSALVFGQQKEIESKMKRFSQKIDSIVSAEKKMMNIEMDAVDKKFEQGKITQEEKMLQKKNIADKFESNINVKVEKENASISALTKDIAMNSIFKKKKDSANHTTEIKLGGDSYIKINGKEVVKQKSSNRKQLSFSYAFLNLADNANSFDAFDSDSRMRIGNSHSFELQSRRERQLGSSTSPFSIRYGISYRTDTYMPKRSLVFVENNGQLSLENFTQGDVKRSKLRNVYFTIPVDFQWVLNPSYVTKNGVTKIDTDKKQFRIGAGFYAGVKTRTIVKVKYYEPDGDFEKYQYISDYGVNGFLFGTKLSLSYGGLHLFVRKDLTPIFNNEAVLPNKYGVQVGIEFLNLNF